MINQPHKKKLPLKVQNYLVKSPAFLELDDLEDGMLKDFYKDSKVDNQK